MFELDFMTMLLFFMNSVLSIFYAKSFLKEKFPIKIIIFVWVPMHFAGQILISPMLGLANVLMMLVLMFAMQFTFFGRDFSKQLFVAFSFQAGKEIIKYVISVFGILLSDVWNKILQFFLGDLYSVHGLIKTKEQIFLFVNGVQIMHSILCVGVYMLIFYIYLREISRRFVRREDHLQMHETVFLVFPAVVGLSVAVTLRMLVVSVEAGTTTIIFEKVPATKFWIPLICILLLCMIVSSVVLFQKLVQCKEEEKNRMVLEKQIYQIQQEVEEIQNIYADIRGLRHDMRNHLENIALLAGQSEGNSNGELTAYIGKMGETVDKLDFSCRTGNPITDVIIRQKAKEAEKKQISFSSDFFYPDKLKIDVYDIAIILNNALENAIEASEKISENRSIELRSYVKGNLFFIDIGNIFAGEIIQREGTRLPVSSKMDQKLHGIGLSNIQRCARKYRGDMDITITDRDGEKWFCLTAMMCGKSPRTDNPL